MHKAFDFDGVILDQGKTLAKIVSKRFGTTIKPEDLFNHNLELQFGVTPDETKEIIDELCSITNTLGSMPCKGAKWVLRNLYVNSGYPITIVTAREDTALVEYYMKIHFAVACNVYHQPHGQKSKTLKDLEVDLFVEDYLMNAIEIANAGIIPVVFLRPWNKYCFSKRSLLYKIGHVVENWNELGKILLKN